MLLTTALLLSPYIFNVLALNEKISVCPSEHTIELISVDDVRILALTLTNHGTEDAYISFWANDTFNNPEATTRHQVLSTKKAQHTRRRFPHLSGNILQEFPSSLPTPTKFLVHLTPENATQTFSATNSSEGIPHRRGDCIVTGKSWLSPIHCRGLTSRTRSSATKCIPYIHYWDEDIWEVSIPYAAQRCTIDEINHFIKALHDAAHIEGVEQDIQRSVGPEGTNTFASGRAAASTSLKRSERSIISNRTSVYTFDPATPPNEWYYHDIDYTYTAWMQMNVSGHREYLALLPESRSVTIMVIDTMVELGHPDLQAGWYANVAEINGVDGVDDDGDGVIDNRYGLNGEDMINGDPVAQSEFSGHGLGVSSIITATPNNDYSIAGYAPHLRVLPCSAGTNTISVLATVNCMNYAIANAKRLNIRIINHSYAGNLPAGVEQEAHGRLFDLGILSTVASGNEDNNLDDPNSIPTYPLEYFTENGYHTIFPAAQHDRGVYTPCGYSKEWIDYLMQGATLISRFSWGAGDGWGVGTSFAAPTLAALLGSMLSINPKLTHYDLHWILRNSLNHVDGFEQYCKYSGYPNFDKALTAAKGTWLTPSEEVVTIAPGETKTVEFTIAPAMDIYRMTDTTKSANIIVYGQDPEDITGVYKLGEIPVNIVIGGGN